MTEQGTTWRVRLHDHLLISLPALLTPVWFIMAGYLLYKGEWVGAIDTAFLGVLWIVGWWMLWLGPRMR